MLGTMSSRTYSRWIAFYNYEDETETSPEHAAFWRAANIAHVIANSAFGNKTKHKIKDFLPQRDEKASQSPGDLRGRMLSLVRTRREKADRLAAKQTGAATTNVNPSETGRQPRAGIEDIGVRPDPDRGQG